MADNKERVADPPPPIPPEGGPADDLVDPGYRAPTGMAALNPELAQEWISNNLNPSAEQRNHLFNHVFVDLNIALNVCCLTSKQGYAVLQQGVTCIGDMDMLGPTLEDI